MAEQNNDLVIMYNKEVTEEEKKVVARYSQGSGLINAVMRNNLNHKLFLREETREEFKETPARIETIFGIMAKGVIGKEVEVERGISHGWIVDGIKTHGLGYTFTDDAFMSFSVYGTGVAQDFCGNDGVILSVTLPVGTSVVDVDAATGKRWEEEVLIAPGTVFRVTHVEDVTWRRPIYYTVEIVK